MSRLDWDTTASVSNRQAPARLQLVIFRGQVVSTHPLPNEGSVVIGRHASCDIPLDDPAISRRHAILHVGDSLRLENLESRNGTSVRGARLDPGQIAHLLPGDVFDMGDTLLMVQPTASAGRARRVLPHSYFEARVDDECLRGDREDRVFSVVRLHVEGTVDAVQIENALASRLRMIDAIASYAPAEYELLLDRSDAAAAEVVLAQINEELSKYHVKMRAGLASYPVDGRTQGSLLARANERLRAGAEDAAPTDTTVVPSVAMQQLYRVVDRIAPSPLSVLILGETGVGKEVMAHHLHERSNRTQKPFVGLNCAALSETLLESELFGHERGSFTGAVATKQGLFESAHGGTVFLDEVGELPMAIQVKLLRVLETRQFQRVGGVKPLSFDVRFVSATNRDLESEIGRGAFRQDLYFRLNGISLLIPPLRERVTEIEGLANLFLDRACAFTAGGQRVTLSAEALALLLKYHWPGNVRELKNVIERAALLTPTSVIQPEHLPLDKMQIRVTHTHPLETRGIIPQTRPAPVSGGGSIHEFSEGDQTASQSPEDKNLSKTELEKLRILRILEQCGGNQTKAAKMLGISRTTLVARLDEYGVPRPRK